MLRNHRPPPSARLLARLRDLGIEVPEGAVIKRLNPSPGMRAQATWRWRIHTADGDAVIEHDGVRCAVGSTEKVTDLLNATTLMYSRQLDDVHIDAAEGVAEAKKPRERLPEHAELKFVVTLSTGTVHVDVYTPVWARRLEPGGEFRMGDGTGRATAALLGTPIVVRCGQRTFPFNPDSDTARHQFTTEFNDSQLCASCYRSLHPDDQHLAFEHDQTDDTEEN